MGARLPVVQLVRDHWMNAPRAYALFALLSFIVTAPAGAQPVLTDSLYLAHHPRLMFTAAEVPALRAKVSDGGKDDASYQFVRGMVHDVYLLLPPSAVLGGQYGLEAMAGIGLVAHLESPPDADVAAYGKLLTTFIANNYNADFNEADSGLRLRSLVLGYDCFFADATEAERDLIRDEIVTYVQKMIWTNNYKAFEYRPYLGNHSAMFSASLGMAAICLQDEADPVILTDALAMADRVAENLLAYQFDPGGTYNEGGLYALWTLRHLIYYFDARKRFDGYAYGERATVRAVERWLPYEMLSEGAVFSHNLNDSPLISAPFARNNTYYDWAMGEWGSGLAAWMWEHTIGEHGVDLGMASDQAATILWYRDVPVVQPGTVLPRSHVWTQRGLYHFRTGWQSGFSSTNDVQFIFYSGKFQGGHAQEDHNQFALYAYGERFALDHGAGGVGKESEAHNMVLIDGKGQHNAGSSIGTDGRIAEYLLGGSADYVMGDASQAYATYSEFNAPNVPFPGTDWSWGYHGANPVLVAERRVLALHDAGTIPYFVIMDDIDKDGTPHVYEWRLHTRDHNSVNTAATPWRIEAGGAVVDVLVLHPSVDSITVATQIFENGNSDPNSKLIRVTRTAINPRFAFVMIPRKDGVPAPAMTQQSYPWGYTCAIDWGGGVVDYLLRNDSGAPAGDGHIETDALVTWVREVNGAVTSYLANGVTSLVVDATDFVTIFNGPLTCEMSGHTINVDRADADFRFFDTGIAKVGYRDQSLTFVVRDGYVVSDGATDVGGAPARQSLALAAHPNPFNPNTTLRISGESGARVRLMVYDVTGRRVRQLDDAVLFGGSASAVWNGRDDHGERVASGTYFVRASTPSSAHTLKLTLLK
jgi:hypothetical protein